MRDLRYAVRMLIRNPGLAAAAAGSLALAIGGSTTVFTLLNAIVLRTLPIEEPDRVFQALRVTATEKSNIFAWPAIGRARAELTGQAEIAAAASIAGMQLLPEGREAAQAERGTVQLVSGEYFSLLRQRAARGRLLEPSDNVNVGGHPVAVVSDGYWRRQLASRDDVVGRTLAVNGTIFTIVGVTAPAFFGTTLSVRTPDVWVPVVMQSTVRYAMNASSHGSADGRKPWPPQEEIEWLDVFVRVPRATDPGTIAAALTVERQREADQVFSAAGFENTRELVRAERIVLEPAARGLSSFRSNVSSSLMVLLAMMGVLLTIACGNVAGLLVARAAAREREVAIRVSLGAGRLQLVRQLLVESLLIGAIAGSCGLLLAVWARTALLRMFAASATLITLDTSFDWRVLSFAVGISIACGVACGLIPAVRGTRTAISSALNAESRGAGGPRRSFVVGKALVALQMAFCLLALVVAGLFVRSLRTLTSMDIGFRPEHVLTARLDVRSLGYAAPERQALYERLLERVRTLPGVESASLSLNGPLSNSIRSGSFAIEGYTPAEGERLKTQEEMVTEEHFDTVGLRIVAGRGFEARDRTAGSRTTLVNETIVRKYFKGRDPIGRRWSYGGPMGPEAFVIVGVVEDAKYVEIKTASPSMTYHLAAATPDDIMSSLEVRTSGRTVSAAAIRQAVAEAEPRLPIFDIVPLTDRVGRVLGQDTLIARLTSIFSLLALLLACLGLYGTISYGINRRTPEIGVRMALGADRRLVLGMILREALVLVAAGALAGVPLALIAGRSVRTLLYQVQPLDPIAYAAGAGLLMAVALAAAFVPAHRASRIEPMVALTKN